MSVWLIEYFHSGGVWLVNLARGVYETPAAAERVCSHLRRQHPGTQYRGREYRPAGGGA